MRAHFLGLMVLLGTAGCNQDSADESLLGSAADGHAAKPTTEMEEPEEEPEDEGFYLSQSETWAALTNEETLSTLCGVAGVLLSEQEEVAESDCEQIVSECRDGVVAFASSEQTQEATGAVPDDLSELLGCPVTPQELDACAARLVTLATDELSDASCAEGSVETPEVSQQLLALACLPLVIKCPELVGSLLSALGQPS